VRCHSPEDGWDDAECSADQSREQQQSSGRPQSWRTAMIGGTTDAMIAEIAARIAVTIAGRGSSAKHALTSSPGCALRVRCGGDYSGRGAVVSVAAAGAPVPAVAELAASIITIRGWPTLGRLEFAGAPAEIIVPCGRDPPRLGQNRRMSSCRGIENVATAQQHRRSRHSYTGWLSRFDQPPRPAPKRRGAPVFRHADMATSVTRRRRRLGGAGVPGRPGATERPNSRCCASGTNTA
jgi:hypothetical protein